MIVRRVDDLDALCAATQDPPMTVASDFITMTG